MKSLQFRVLPALLLSLIVAGSAQAEFKTYRGKVLKVVDGDTINFLPSGALKGEKPWSIRMISTDTPETHLPGKGGPYSQGVWGEEAHAQLAKTVRVGETIEVDSYGRDGYGRVLGRVWKRGNVDVNLEMLESGWAALYIICDDVSCDEKPKYRKACDIAKDRGLGIFDPHHKLPQLPFLFRSIKQKRPLSKFVGNVRTKRYYKPEQYARVPICDRTFFMAESDARREGYVPAR